MRIRTLVQYETGIAESGVGRVVDFDEETEIVTVQDVDDNSTWRGSVDHATIIEEQQILASEFHDQLNCWIAEGIIALQIGEDVKLVVLARQ